MSFNASCQCGGAGCQISANGTLVPPVAGMTSNDLQPAGLVPWKVLDSTGAVQDQGMASIVNALDWSLTSTSGQPGQSYTVKIEPTWVFRVPSNDAEAVTC